jgi:site-specific DNA-methyltransferase (adenine-specific)
MDIRTFGDEDHKVFQGDALSALDLVPNGSVNLIFADPPYNIGKRFGDFVDAWESDEAYADWCMSWLEKCIEKLSANGSLYVMSSTQCIPYLDILLRKKLNILSRIVWSYDSSGVQAKNHFGSMYEPILFCVKDKENYIFNNQDILVEAKTGSQRKLIDYRKAIPTPYNTQKVPGNVWEFPRVRYRMEEYEEHPTQKPEALLERVILASSNPGDVVMDPFSGTFTTGAVAKRLNRKTINIELNLDYVGIGLRRLGLATELDGKKLSKPAKSTKRRETVGDNVLKLDLA